MSNLLWLCFWLQAAQSPFDEGVRAFQSGNLPGAERAFIEALKTSPSHFPALKLLGMVYASQEKYTEAETPLKKACALQPSDDDACYYLGRLYSTTARLDESVAAFETARKHGKRLGRTLHGLALTLEALGRSEEAERSYRRALELGEEKALADFERFQKRHFPAPETSRRPVRFEPSELPVALRNGARGRKHLPETMLGGVAVFDFDNDGWPDIFVANGAEMPSLRKTGPEFANRLYRNLRDGRFEDVTERAALAGSGYSIAASAGDYDNDGHIDLLVAGVHGVRLYRNSGDGSFQNVTRTAGLDEEASWAVGAAWLDYDRDGLLDLFVVRYVVWDPHTEPSCGNQLARTYCHPRLYAPLPNTLYRNLGGGRFQDVSQPSRIAKHLGKGMAVVVCDADGDGWLDIFVTNDAEPNFLFRNRGDGTFEEMAMAAGVAWNEDGKAASFMGADWADFDNDGRFDLAVTALTDERHSLFRNLGRGMFEDVRSASGLARHSLPYTGWGIGFADLNNDGGKDLFLAHGHVMDNVEATSSRKSRQPNLVLLNAGGIFTSLTLPGEALHRGLAFGDLDRDGRIDAVVTRINEPPLVLWNRSPQSGNWIAFRLQGTQSPRQPIGARVGIETAEGRQWSMLRTAIGYASSSEPTVHFGLDSATAVKKAIIEWPSGVRQTIQSPTPGEVNEILEP